MDRTYPRLLRDNAGKWGDRVWMRKKEFGYWREYTWGEAYEKTKHFALGLISLGFRRGDLLAILGDNDPHWFWAELAAQCAGGAITGPFSSCSPEEAKYICSHSDARFVVVEDQEQVDKMLQIKDDLPLVKRIVYWDPKGLRNYQDTSLLSFDGVAELGREYERRNPGVFDDCIDQSRGDDLALIMYTSGTTGLPKGAIMTYNSIFSSHEVASSLYPMYPTDRWLSFILPGWMAEQAIGIINSLKLGMTMNFPEEQDTVQDNVREIGASILFYPSRLWENVASTIQNRMTEAGILNRLVYRLCLPIGYRAADAKFAGKKLNLFWRALYALAKLVVFDPLRDKLGLLKVRYAYTSGALLGPETFRLITAIGVDLRQSYGSSEMGVCGHTADAIKVDSVGRVFPQTIVRIMDDNHILARGPAAALGYYKDPEATAKKFAGGWYHTGDAGYMDEDGHIYYLDRLEYMSTLANGTRFAPQAIEARLKFSPYVKDAYVVGDETRDYVAVIINIDLDNVGYWAERRGIAYTTFVDLTQKPQVLQLIGGEIERLNKKLPEGHRIKRFVNMPKQFDPDEAELTRTMKLRRGFLDERYRDIVEALYGKSERMTMEVPVVYRDGRKATIRSETQVVTVGSER